MDLKLTLFFMMLLVVLNNVGLSNLIFNYQSDLIFNTHLEIKKTLYKTRMIMIKTK